MLCLAVSYISLLKGIENTMREKEKREREREETFLSLFFFPPFSLLFEYVYVTFLGLVRGFVELCLPAHTFRPLNILSIVINYT